MTTKKKPQRSADDYDDYAPRGHMPAFDQALLKASEVGDLAECKRLIARGANPNSQDGYLQTALHYAAWKGQNEVAELLITKMRSPDAFDKYKNSPLHYAASCGHLDVVELLVSKGADVQAKDKGGLTPIDYAKKYKRADVVAHLKPLMATETRQLLLNELHIADDHAS